MQMKKKVLAAALTGLLASSGAFAVVDLDAAVATPSVYASELVAAGTALTDAALDVQTKLGFGVSNTQTRYIRLDLGNATLNTASAAIGGVAALANQVVVQGGGATDTFVIVQITADADYAATDIITVDLSNIKVTAPSAAVTVAYSLYEDAPSAAAGGASGRIYAKSGTLATFASGLDFDVVAGQATASVEADFEEFTGATLSATVAKLGTLSLGTTAGVLNPAGAPVALGDLVAATTSLVLAGDFAAAGANDLFLDDVAGDCSNAGAFGATLNTGKTQATIDGLEAGLTSAALCYNVTGTTAIVAQTVTGALDVTAAVGATTADVAAQTVGTIVRDGTTLMSPLVQVPSGWISRLVLVNTGTRDRAYSLSVQGEDGNTITTGATSGTIPAGKTVVLNSSDVLTAFSASPRATVQAVVAAPNDQIQGLYQIVNPVSGSISNHVMVRPGTN